MCNGLSNTYDVELASGRTGESYGDNEEQARDMAEEIYQGDTVLGVSERDED